MNSSAETVAAREAWRQRIEVDGQPISSSVQAQVCRATTLVEFRRIERNMGWTPEQFIDLRRRLFKRRYGVQI